MNCKSVTPAAWPPVSGLGQKPLGIEDLYVFLYEVHFLQS